MCGNARGFTVCTMRLWNLFVLSFCASVASLCFSWCNLRGLLREVSNELKKAVMILFLHSSGGIGIYIWDRKLVLWWELFSPSMVLLRCNNGSKSAYCVWVLWPAKSFWASRKNYVYASLYTSPCCHMDNYWTLKCLAVLTIKPVWILWQLLPARVHYICFMWNQVLVGCPNVILNRCMHNRAKSRYR